MLYDGSDKRSIGQSQQLENIFLDSQMEMAYLLWLQKEGLDEEQLTEQIKQTEAEFKYVIEDNKIDFYLYDKGKNEIIKLISTVEYKSLDEQTAAKLMGPEKICTALFDRVYGKESNQLRKSDELLGETKKLINKLNERL